MRNLNFNYKFSAHARGQPPSPGSGGAHTVAMRANLTLPRRRLPARKEANRGGAADSGPSQSRCYPMAHASDSDPLAGSLSLRLSARYPVHPTQPCPLDRPRS